MENIKLLVSDYNDGVSFKQLEKKYNIPSTTIFRYFKTHNLLNDRKPVRYKDYNCEPYITFKKLYTEEQLSIAEIAKRCSCSICKVQKYLEKHHLTRTNQDSKELRGEKNTKNSNYFEIIDTAEKAYWLGFLMADGSISKNGYTCVLSLAECDKSHLQQFGDIFGIEVKNYTRFDKRTGKTYYSSSAIISNRKIVNDLIEIGMSNNKTYRLNKDVFMNIPNTLKKDFIRGYFDGDGSAVGNKISFTSCSSDFLFCIGDYITHTLEIQQFAIRENKNCFTIAWYKNFNLRKISEWLYYDGCLCLPRKIKDVNKFKMPIKRTWNPQEEHTLSKVSAIQIKDKSYINALFPNRTYDAVYRKYRRIIR